MTTYYIRPTAGSDAAAGTSFATAWQTITSGATAARIAPGDVIRIEKSPDPTSLGMTAAWTNKSVTVTLNSALTTNISTCETAWTASANVTTTTTATRKEGSLAMQATIAAGFTTGLACYLALGGATDFSAYKQVSLWIKSDVAVTAGNIYLALCSDTAGATPVDTIALGVSLKAGQWVPIVYDKGSALGSSIQSIGLYVNSDFGAAVITLDNILACKDSTAADSLTLKSLIGKNTTGESWWIIRSINGTTVTLDIAAQTTAGTSSRGYSGTTETVTTYKRECWTLTRTDGNSLHIINDSGTSVSALISYEGGWDSTAMTTQDGYSFFDGLHSGNVGLDANSQNFISINRIGMVRCSTSFNLNLSSAVWYASNIYAIGSTGSNSATFVGGGTNPSINFSGNIFINQGTGSGLNTNISTVNCGSTNFYVKSMQTNGWVDNSTNHGILHTGTANCSNNGSMGFSTTGTGRLGSFITNDNSSSGFEVPTSCGILEIDSLASAANSAYGISIAGNSPYVKVRNGYTSSGNGVGSVQHTNQRGSILILNNATYSEGTFVSAASFAQGGNNQVRTANENSANVHITRTDGGTIRSETGSDRHTASGVAWKLSPTNVYRSSTYPLSMKVAEFAVASSGLVTFKAWIKRTSSSNIGARLVVYSGEIGGVSSDVITQASGASNTYQEETLTFTPSEAGTVRVFFEVYATSTSTTDSAFIDDITITQA